MTKEELIKQLNNIPGNPEIFIDTFNIEDEFRYLSLEGDIITKTIKFTEDPDANETDDVFAEEEVIVLFG